MRASEMASWWRARRSALCVLFCSCLVLTSVSAVAADKRSAREREMASRLQQMQVEKTRLDQENSGLKAKVSELELEVERMRQTEAAVKRDLAGIRREKTDLGEQLKKSEAGSADLSQRLSDAQATIGKREREKAIVESVVDEQVGVIGRQAKLIETCEAKNARLYSAGMAALAQFRESGGQGWALLGFDRVKAFDSYQAFRDQFESERVGGSTAAQ